MDLPPSIVRCVDGWNRVSDEEIGRSNATMLVFESGRRRRFVKVAHDGRFDRLEDAADRLRWFGHRLSVPEVVSFERVEDAEFLVTEGLPGLMACDPTWNGRLEELITVVARGLREFHASPSTDCPFDRSPHTLLTEARRRVEEGAVDADDFDQPYLGRTPEQLLTRLAHRIPERFVPTLVHGDFSLPNVIIDDDGIGFVDLGRAGVGDRHLDLAVAANSVAYNWGEEWVPRLFEAYGQFPDPERLGWYRMLDELF